MRISNGNFLDEDGNEVNLVELLRTGKATPVVNNNDGHHMSAHSGWFTDENGTPVNIVALINAAIDEDGGDDKPAIGGISVNGGNVVTPDENGIINLTISGDGSTVIDSKLSKSSTNPVQNKIVAGEIEDLNEAVDSLNGSLGNVIGINTYVFTDGGYITTSNTGTTASITPVANSAYSHIIIPCTAGQSFAVTGETDGNSGRRVYMFLDTSYKVLSRYTESATVTAQQATAESDGYLVVNTFTASAHSVEDYRSNTVIEQLAEVESGIADVSADLSGKTGLTSNTWTDGYYIALNTATVDISSPVASTHFSYMVLDCSGGDVFTVKIHAYANLNTSRAWCFIDSNGKNLAVENNAVSADGVIVAPTGSAKLIVNTYDRRTHDAYVYKGVTGNGLHTIISDSIDRSGVITYPFMTGYITSVAVGSTASSTPSGDRSWCYVLASCTAGQPFIITAKTDGNSARRVVMFLDVDMKCISRYTDSSDISDMLFVAPVDGFVAVNSYNGQPHKVVSSYPNNLFQITKNKIDIDDIIKAPLTTLAPNLLGALAYRPLGALSKGYICLITDDGKTGLATDTIPLAIQKNIPMTFAVWSTSDVFLDDTAKATVIDAITNHGCSLAQHGGSRWDDKSERWLNEFFDAEAEAWATMGVEVHGAVIPGHWTNELIKAVCGGRFGVVRSGGEGTDYDTQESAGTVTNYYSYYTSGERSNIFCLSSYNCAVDAAISNSNAQNKAAIDYAFANNKILIAYWHENQMDSARLSAVADMIDYAKTKGLEFVTLGQIPYLL